MFMIRRRWHNLQKLASEEGVSASWADADQPLLLGFDWARASPTPFMLALLDKTTHLQKPFHGFQSSQATGTAHPQLPASMPAPPSCLHPRSRSPKSDQRAIPSYLLHLLPLMVLLPLGTQRLSSLHHGLLLLLPQMCCSSPSLMLLTLLMSPRLSHPLFLPLWSMMSLGLRWALLTCHPLPGWVTDTVSLLLSCSLFVSSPVSFGDTWPSPRLPMHGRIQSVCSCICTVQHPANVFAPQTNGGDVCLAHRPG